LCIALYIIIVFVRINLIRCLSRRTRHLFLYRVKNLQLFLLFTGKCYIFIINVILGWFKVPSKLINRYIIFGAIVYYNVFISTDWGLIGYVNNISKLSWGNIYNVWYSYKDTKGCIVKRSNLKVSRINSI
jgi:hypothetical protein